jgi:hypothetical protein
VPTRPERRAQPVARLASLHGVLRRPALAETLARLWQLAENGLVSSPPGDPARWLRSSNVHR